MANTLVMYFEPAWIDFIIRRSRDSSGWSIFPARTGKSDLAEEDESTGSMGRDNAPSSPHLPVSPMERILSASGPFSSN